MKKEVKLIIQSMKEKNIRVFLGLLNVLNKQDIETVDEQTGLNLIHYCAQENTAKELLLIISYVPDLNLNLKTHGIVQKTALEIAFAMNNKDVSKILIKNGAILENPKKIKKLFKDDLMFSEVINDAIQRALPEKKKRLFFSFS